MDQIRRQIKNNKMRDLAKVRRRKITIRKKVVTIDEWENQIETWVDWRTIWAELESLWGQDYYAAKALNQESTVIFVVKYAPFLDQLNTVDYCVVFNPTAYYDHDPTTDVVSFASGAQPMTAVQARNIDKVYDINHIDRLKDDGMWVKLRCLERGLSG